MKKRELALMALVIIFAVYVGHLVITCQGNAYIQFSNYCNETYGEGNWIIVEGGHEARKNVSAHIGPIVIPYIGQVWECVPCNQT